MNEVVKFLNENPVQYLATVGRDGKAKCRPFMFAGEKDGKLWFCTNNQKDVYKDMQENPYVEVSVSEKAKSGKYGLLEFQDKRSGLANIRSVTLNGSEYKLGDEFKLGKHTAKLYIGAFGRDSKTENDLILEIGK